MAVCERCGWHNGQGGHVRREPWVPRAGAPLPVLLVAALVGLISAVGLLLGTLALVVGGSLAWGARSAGTSGAGLGPIVILMALLGVVLPFLGFCVAVGLVRGRRAARGLYLVVSALSVVEDLLEAAGTDQSAAGSVLVRTGVALGLAALLYIPDSARLHFDDMPHGEVDGGTAHQAPARGSICVRCGARHSEPTAWCRGCRQGPALPGYGPRARPI